MGAAQQRCAPSAAVRRDGAPHPAACAGEHAARAAPSAGSGRPSARQALARMRGAGVAGRAYQADRPGLVAHAPGDVRRRAQPAEGARAPRGAPGAPSACGRVLTGRRLAPCAIGSAGLATAQQAARRGRRAAAQGQPTQHAARLECAGEGRGPARRSLPRAWGRR